MLEPPQAGQGGVVPDRGHDEQRGETRVGVRLGLAPVQDTRALLVERLEHIGGKVNHGGLPCHTRTCDAGEKAPGARRTAGAATPTAPGEPCPDDSPCQDVWQPRLASHPLGQHVGTYRPGGTVCRCGPCSRYPPGAPARVSLPGAGHHAHFWARGCTTWPLLPQHPHPSSRGLIRGVPVPRAPGVRRAVLPSPDNALSMLTECPRDSPLRPWIRPSACLHALGHACGGSPGLWGVSRAQRSGTNYAEDHNHASSRQSCQKPRGCAGERLTGQRCFKQRRMLPHPRPALTRPTWSRFWATARLTTFSVSPCQGRKHLMYWSGQDTSGVRGTGLLTWP